LLGHDETDRGQYDRLLEPLAVTGCALLVRRHACEQLGGFDEAFFAYLDDADLCLRARRAGLHVAAVPSARVRHDRAPPPRLHHAGPNPLWLLALHAPQPAWRARLRSARVLSGYLAYALRGDPSGAAERIAAVRRGARDYTGNKMGPM